MRLELKGHTLLEGGRGRAVWWCPGDDSHAFPPDQPSAAHKQQFFNKLGGQFLSNRLESADKANIHTYINQYYREEHDNNIEMKTNAMCCWRVEGKGCGVEPRSWQPKVKHDLGTGPVVCLNVFGIRQNQKQQLCCLTVNGGGCMDGAQEALPFPPSSPRRTQVKSL